LAVAVAAAADAVLKKDTWCCRDLSCSRRDDFAAPFLLRAAAAAVGRIARSTDDRRVNDRRSGDAIRILGTKDILG
jgi:hypothetical protein